MNTNGPEQGGAEADALVRDRRDLNNRRGLPFSAVAMVAFSVLSMLLLLLPAGISYSADEDITAKITWFHGSPADVTSFVIFVSPEPGLTSSTWQENVGKPSKPGDTGSGTPRNFVALVTIDVNDFVAVAAIGRNGILSELSVWSLPALPAVGEIFLKEN
jgi:hypothetical protein